MTNISKISVERNQGNSSYWHVVCFATKSHLNFPYFGFFFAKFSFKFDVCLCKEPKKSSRSICVSNKLVFIAQYNKTAKNFIFFALKHPKKKHG